MAWQDMMGRSDYTITTAHPRAIYYGRFIDLSDAIDTIRHRVIG